MAQDPAQNDEGSRKKGWLSRLGEVAAPPGAALREDKTASGAAPVRRPNRNASWMDNRTQIGYSRFCGRNRPRGEGAQGHGIGTIELHLHDGAARIEVNMESGAAQEFPLQRPVMEDYDFEDLAVWLARQVQPKRPKDYALRIRRALLKIKPSGTMVLGGDGQPQD